MVGIFVDGDLVGAPIPVVAEAVVGGEDAEGEASKPEAFAIAAFDAPDVAGAEAARKVAMSPGMIDMIVGIVLAGVMTDPFAIGVDVWGIRMTDFVDIIGSGSGMSVSLGRRGTMSRGVRRRRS